MKAPRRALAMFLLLASIGACGPTLTRGPTGWHESTMPFTIAPLADGSLFAEGWGLRGYTLKDDGYRREAETVDGANLELIRSEDDGALFVASYPIDEADRNKLAEVLAGRWITRVVRSPLIDDNLVHDFEAVVPLRKTTASTPGWPPVTASVLSGRNVQIDQQSTFTVPGGDGAESTSTLSPPGSPADRRLYVAVIKQTGGERFVLVTYGNSVAAFDKGLPDATAFARRIRF